jgi:formiminoglutamate deiminase
MTVWHAQSAWLGGGDLARNVLIRVEHGIIRSIEHGTPEEADARLTGMVLPGLVSAHSHAFHRRLRGRTHGSDFWAWREPMYTIANSLTPETYQALATKVYSEMVEAGITTVGEFHYIHHRPDGTPYDDPNAFGHALINAATQTGIRMTLIDTAYLTSDVTGKPVLDEQARFSDGSVGAWTERVTALSDELASNDRVRLGVAAHSVRGVRARDLGPIAATARDLGVPLHVHVSEQIAENEATRAEHGVSPVGLLAREGVLGPTTTLIHATHLAQEDIDLIVVSGSMVCFCPTTESDLGDGIGPAMELVDAGVPLCLGSDSNAVIDILREAHRLEQHDRLRLMRRGIHTPEALMATATVNGMRSLGWNDAGLVVGAPADFISIDTESNELVDTEESLGAVVSAATRASITDVIVAGERVKG